jgi:polyhydroxyalkanoate synthesis regulator phasin
MRWFKRVFERKDTTELLERVEELARQFRRLEEEWTDVYSKFRVMQMRVAKQVQRLDESSQEEPQQEGGEGAEVQGRITSLSPRMQKIQNEILARRGRAVANGKEGE